MQDRASPTEGPASTSDFTREELREQVRVFEEEHLWARQVPAGRAVFGEVLKEA